MNTPDKIEERRKLSEDKLKSLRAEVEKSLQNIDTSDFCIFSAGSYGRLEAGEYSDLDLFFVQNDGGGSIRERSTQVFATLIEVNRQYGLPPFTNDCEHLVVHSVNEIVDQLGSRTDDYSNVFTLRMLLLLESRPFLNDLVYQDVVTQCVNSYWRDYYGHEKTFEPAIVLNDIARYWYTLQMNYEHKRNQREEAKKLKQKVRNFKIKFSRRMTCFVSSCYLGSLEDAGPEAMVKMVYKTPIQRLIGIVDNVRSTEKTVEGILSQYSDFLDFTRLPTQELEEYFKDRESKIKMFDKANEFKNSFSQLVRDIDKERPGFIDRLML